MLKPYGGNYAHASGWDMNHEGHVGWRADQIVANISSWASATRPDVALIHLGSNDISQNQSVDSTVSEIRSIIEKLRAVSPNISVVLAQIIPIRVSSINNKIIGSSGLNAKLQSLATAMNTSRSKVFAVDLYTGFDARSDLYDNYHPSPSGEEKMATRFYAALQSVLGNPGGIPDTARPTIPAGVEALPQENSTVLVRWRPSTDNVRVVGYDIFRDGVMLSRSVTTSFTDNTGLTPATLYRYKVAARDAAGNVSPFSTEVSVTTLSAAADSSWVYEAEWATVVGARAYGSYVDYINNSGDYIEWTVSVPAAGSYNLSFKYAFGGGSSRPLQISINGNVLVPSLDFPATGSTAVYRTVSIPVTLLDDINTIRATAIGASGGNMDSLTVTRQ
jgi:hypothetical protein